MFCVASFHTEGQPHDSGRNLAAAAASFRERVEPCCDLFVSHTPRSLSSLSPGSEDLFRDYNEWVESHPERGSVRKFNPEWAALGFMRWKPLFVRHVLESIPKGGVLMYHDSDCVKYPEYLVGAEEWGAVSEAVLSELGSDIMVPYEMHQLEVGCKRFLLDRYGADGGQMSLWSGVLIFRKSEASMLFVTEWLEMSSLENSAPFPDGGSSERLVWHSPDQSTASVLAQLWKRRGMLDAQWPRFSFYDRVISWETVVELS